MPLGLLWDVATKTALVLAVMYVALILLRRFWGGAGTVRTRPLMAVLQSAQLGPGRSVHLIGIGDKMVLVGATSHQVSLLAEMDSPETASNEDPGEGKHPFEQYLSRAAEVAVSGPLGWRKAAGMVRGSRRDESRGTPSPTTGGAEEPLHPTGDAPSDEGALR